MNNDRKISLPNYTSTGRTAFSRQYVLDNDNVAKLCDELHSLGFITIAKLYTNPIDNLISLYAYPFDVRALSSIWSQMQNDPTFFDIGKYRTTQAKGSRLALIPTPILDLGSVQVTKYYNNFLDYAPYTKVELYLPYIGYEMLDVDMVMGKTINIKYAVDLFNGSCTAFITIGSGTAETLIMQRNGQIGIPIQLNGNNSDIARNLIRLGISSVASVTANKVAGGVATTASQAMTQETAKKVANVNLLSSSVDAVVGNQITIQKSGGSNGGNTAYYAPQNAFLVYTRPNVDEPTSYTSLFGKPLMETRRIGELTGYTEIADVHIEGDYFGTITEDERNELDRMLKEGVIL